MKLEEQVAPLALSIKLKELGIVQESVFYHIQQKTPTNSNLLYYGWPQNEMPINVYFRKKSNLSGSVIYFEVSAFTVAEICDMLPDLIISDNLQYELVIVKESEDSWLCQYSRNNNLLDSLQHIDRVYRKTMAEAVAYMLIHLLELGKITAEECNQRLIES